MVAPADRMFVRDYINDNCIVRVEPGSKELPSYMNQGSGYYTWQFYLREAFFNPKILDIVVQDFLARYEELIKSDTIQLCGVESASTPLLTAIAIACSIRGYDINIFSIRKERKTYGKKNWLEGRVLDNKPAMIIDDIVSETHKTACHAANVLYNQAIPIADHCYATVHKTDKPENDKIRLLYRTLTVGSMFCLNDFDLYLKDYSQKKQQRFWIG